MTLCQREKFYQVDLLSPAKVKITDREYWVQRKGQAKLDIKNKEKPIRGRPLGTDFEKEHLQEYLLQKQIPHISIPASDTKEVSSKRPLLAKSIRLIVDVEANIKAQQNRFYAQKMKVGNLQQMSKTLAFLQENGIGTIEELESLLVSTQSDFDEKRLGLKSTEDRLKTVNLLIKNSGQYLANKKIYGEYVKAKNRNRKNQNQHYNLHLLELTHPVLISIFVLY